MAIVHQLFLSKSVVTASEMFDGGVLVDDKGIIEDVLRRDQCEIILKQNDSNIKVVDGGDLALLAGVVDSHVHVNEPGRTAWEGFRSATAAAAVGGVTTIIDMPLNSIPPTTTLANLNTKVDVARENVYVDVGFWGGVIPGNQDSLKDLINAGVIGFKCFLCPSGVEEFPNVNSDDLDSVFAALEDTGSLLAFHAELETEELLHLNCAKLNKDPEEYQTYLESRSSDMEICAVKIIMDFVKKTSVRVHIVHVSSADVIPLLESGREARRVAGSTQWRGGVTAETCHHYLTLSAEQVPRGRSDFKCAPPIREHDNKDKLWQHLLEDKLDLVVSDHSPCTSELKCSNHLEAWGGISSLQFGLSLLWTAAKSRGQDLGFVTRYLSAGPARLCKLDDRKGELKPGLDADLIFFDPEATFVVTEEIIRHKNKITKRELSIKLIKLIKKICTDRLYSEPVIVRDYHNGMGKITSKKFDKCFVRNNQLTPYINHKLKGVVKQTYLRGQLIFSEGNILEEPKGKLLIKSIL